MSPPQQSKCRKFVDLFIHTTGDLNKNSGLEIEFLLDTGATCSVVNFNTFQAKSDIGQIFTVVQTQTRTTALNFSEIPMLGYTILPLPLDIAVKYELKEKVWITHEHTAQFWGVQFFHEYC